MIQGDPNLYRTLLENLSDGVMVIGFDGTMQLANAAACRMFGLDPEETIGRPFGELFIAVEGLDEFSEIILGAVVERGDLARRVTRVRVGDEDRSLSVTTSCLTADGNPRSPALAVIAVVSDITEVRELRESEVRQAEVIETQLGELRDAYRNLEARNEALSVMTRRVRTVRGTAVLFVLGLFVAIGVWYFRPLDFFSATAALYADAGAEPGDPATLPTFVAEPQTLRSTIDLRGNLAPGRVADIVSPIESHIHAIHVTHGQRVVAGDLLVELETGPLEAEHRRAEVEVIKARNRLAEIEGWEDSPSMARARATLRRARISLEDAEQNLHRTAFLLDEGIIPANEFEDAKRQRENRRLDFEAAGRELETEMEKGGEEARRVAQLEAESAEARLHEQAEKLTYSRILAPIDGIVVAAESSQGEPLTRGLPVGQGELMLSIAELDYLSVTSSVDEVDVGRIDVGQSAWITGPGFPELQIDGEVAHVSSRAESAARGRGQAPEFEVVINLDRLDGDARERLRVGMSAYVTIVVHHRPEALLIPLVAVEQGASGNWVRVLDRNTGTSERQAVTLGLTTLDSVEVVEGLQAGDEVVLAR